MTRILRHGEKLFLKQVRYLPSFKLTARAETDTQWYMGRPRRPKHMAVSFVAPGRNIFITQYSEHSSYFITYVARREDSSATIRDPNAWRIIRRGTGLKMYPIPPPYWFPGCLNSLSIYKLALARLQGNNVKEEVVKMISKLARDDPMRAGRYQEWRTEIKGQ